MSWDDRGNTASAWDAAYTAGDHWDQIDGGAITRAFADALIANLDPDTQAACASGSILDWGCGRGEMTHTLRERFPGAVIVGQDFSAVAIAAARKAYGEQFICAEQITGEWDVIIASNVLEHLLEPRAVMREHMRHTPRYVAMVPYEEALGPGEGLTPEQRRAAGHAHLHRFGADDLGEFEGWRTVNRTVVEPGPAWPGRQLIQVWAR